MLKKYNMDSGNHGSGQRQNSHLKNVYGQADQALALKPLNNMDKRKQQYLEQKKQNQLLQLYNHKKIISNQRKQHHSPSGYNRGSSGQYGKPSNRDHSMPNVKHGVKLPAINSNLLYSPNLQNLNKAKLSQIERTYVSNENLAALKRRQKKQMGSRKKRHQYKKESFE